MWAISSRAAEPATQVDRPPFRAKPRHGWLVDAGLVVFCLSMLGLMLRWKTDETVPYHLLFLALAIVYGFRVWPLLATSFVLVAVTLSTGAIMYADYLSGGIKSASELTEIWLMPALLVAMVWHARRRATAQRQAEYLADRHQANIEREREFFRDTSHAIRTPVTIARGHLELLEPQMADPVAREDVAIVLRQLGRMSALSNRLLALAQLDSGIALRPTHLDLSVFISEVGNNWCSSAPRDWMVDPPEQVWVEADPEWLSLAVDALVENAVRFTDSGDRIRVSGLVTHGSVALRVEDSGPGIAPEDSEDIFRRFWHRRAPGGEMGSGLGLPMARAIARAHGGEITATARPAEGAMFELQLPALPPDQVQRAVLELDRA